MMKKSSFSIFLLVFALSFFSGLQSCNDDAVESEEESAEDMSFDTNSQDVEFSNAVIVTYSGTTASVTNPFESSGISAVIKNGDVTITSTIADTEVDYVLLGIANEGSFKLYSDYKFGLILNGVGITNSNGPAINIQSGKKASVTVVDGTINKLVDGETYAASDEDQKGTFFSEGQLVFSGAGDLSVAGKYKHAIGSDDYVSITEGNITIASAVSDGIHVSDYFEMNGGVLTISSSGDGVDVEEGYVDIAGGSVTVESVDDGIVASYDGEDVTIVPYVKITGGIIDIKTSGDKSTAIRSEGDVTIDSDNTIALTVSGKASKGFKTAGNFTVTKGDISITTSGAAFYDAEDSDIAAAAGVNCDGDFSMASGVMTISSTGIGGKGISVDGAISIGDGSINIVASGSDFVYGNQTSEAKGIKGDGAVTIEDGSVNISAADDGIKSETSITINGGDVIIGKSTEGVEAPLITINNGNVSVISSDDCLNATKGNGGESNDGSLLTLAGGTVSLNSSGGDPLDGNGSIVMTGGTVIVQGPPSSPEVAIDYNGTFKISGGLLIASGPNGNMIQATSTSSTQYTALVKINGNVSANTLFHVQDASGNDLVTYAPARTAYYFVLSSPALQSGSAYTVFTGGSVSGGTKTNGLTTGGSYTAGSQKGSFTVSSKVTTANF